MPTVVITGANRGLGLEFSKQYHSDGWEVVACCRRPEEAEALRGLGVEIHLLDVSDEASIGAFARRLGDAPVDLLINNAAIHDRIRLEGFSGIETDCWLEAFKVNVMGPVLLTRALLENLSSAERPVAATIGSQQGCLTLYETGGLYQYRTTKAAAHAAAVIMSKDLQERRIPYVCLRPGHTKTDMGGADAPYEVADSVALMRKTLASVGMEQTGRFIDRSGEFIPWSLERDLNE